MSIKIVSTILLAAVGLSACVGSGPQQPVAVTAMAPVTAMPAAPDYGPVLGSDGRCIGTAPGTASVIEPGIGECDLIRLKGRPATDVLVGEGKGTREVQVLYSEPGGRELYMFVNNRLDRIVR